MAILKYKKYLALKPQFTNSIPIVKWLVLSYDFLKDARHCSRVNNGQIVIARVLEGELKKWKRLSKNEHS